MRLLYSLLLFFSISGSAQENIHSGVDGYLIKEHYTYFDRVVTYWFLIESPKARVVGSEIIFNGKPYTLVRMVAPSTPQQYSYGIVMNKLVSISEAVGVKKKDSVWNELEKKYDEIILRTEYQLKSNRSLSISYDTLSLKLNYEVYKVNIRFSACLNQESGYNSYDSVVGIIESVNNYFRLSSTERKLFRFNSNALFEFLRSKDVFLNPKKQ